MSFVREAFPRRFSQFGEEGSGGTGRSSLVVDMNPAERVQHGIPDRYSDYDTRCTRKEIERYHCVREQFMLNRLLEAQAGEQNSVLVLLPPRGQTKRVSPHSDSPGWEGHKKVIEKS